MAVGRTTLITGTFASPQQVAYANQTITFTLTCPAGPTALLEYQVAADPANGEVVAQTSASFTLDGSGTLGAGAALTAPQDVQLNIGGVLSAANAYYTVTGPGGIYITTTNFAYSGSPRDIGVVNAQTTPLVYTTAAVTIAYVTPGQTGFVQTVTAQINTDCYVAGGSNPVLGSAARFQTTLAGNGTGTLNLVPNALCTPVNSTISSANTYWTLTFGNNGPSFPIRVGLAGGAATALVVRVTNGRVVAPPLGTFMNNLGGLL